MIKSLVPSWDERRCGEIHPLLNSGPPPKFIPVTSQHPAFLPIQKLLTSYETLQVKAKQIITVNFGIMVLILSLQTVTVHEVSIVYISANETEDPLNLFFGISANLVIIGFFWNFLKNIFFSGRNHLWCPFSFARKTKDWDLQDSFFSRWD